FGEVVDVVVAAIAHVGQHHRHRIVVVAFAEAQRGQRHAALAMVLDGGFQGFLVDRAHVEITVGAQDYPVYTVLDEALSGLRIGQLDAGPAIGGTAGAEAVDGGIDGGVLVAGSGRQGDAGGTGIGDDRHPVLL